MTGYPIQTAKVQGPVLRDQTLARHRLLDWLAAKIHHRVILVIADAGYGKTTLLADFSGRTRVRTLWYRLDDDDRDWISFLSHLVAAGRTHDPGFAPNTAALLSDLAMGGPTREAATEVFLRELPAIAEHGAMLILDDFHLVDESPDVRLIVRELVAAAPERLSIVFASRRVPSIPLARLRATGEVAEIGTDELRFDPSETARLFSETYGRELDPDVLADVAAKTEGWAASLQLVQAALRDRTPVEIRQFIRGLSGADQEVYDYLAEEVVGDLPDALQQFLMRTSILQVVTMDLACAVTGLDGAEVTNMTAAAERLTLLGRPPRSGKGPQRYHPLVREFLEARLFATIGPVKTAELHRRAAAVASVDWHTAAYHFRKAGDDASVASTIARAIPEIMGGGQHAVAVEEIDRLPTAVRPPVLDLVVSRIKLQRRDYVSAIELSRAVLETVGPGSQESDFALLNLLTLHMEAGHAHEAKGMAHRLDGSTRNEQLKQIAVAAALMIDSTDSGSLVETSRHLLAMSEGQRGVHPHYFGVTMLNLSLIAVHLDQPLRAVEYAREAIEALEGTSSQIELSAAYMALASPLALLGKELEAEQAIGRALRLDEIEAGKDQAELADSFLDPESARALLNSLGDSRESMSEVRFPIQSALYFARRTQFEAAVEALSERQGDGVVMTTASTRLLVTAYVAVASGSPTGLILARDAKRSAKAQGAVRWWRTAELLEACAQSPDALSREIKSIGAISPWNLTYVADLIAARLGELDDAALQSVGSVATLHPARWRFVLREQMNNASLGQGLAAARLLESIGERADIGRLRAYARRQRRLPGASRLGRSLARRLADRVAVEDQGRVSVVVGERHVAGSTIRRKVLALLCFLLTRQGMSSTRDQVLEALWPELDPLDALNSLNQTVYFLRRVLEEPYVDDLSPGYLHHDSDLIWLDQDLVSSRSNECREILRSFPASPDPDEVESLVDAYRGRFALDFEYEDWAGPYRDWLHASYLEVVERAVTSDLETGHFDRGIRLARRALDVDPEAEHVEFSLLRLLRASGAHAAAAEQYAHYATAMREQLGMEPPPLETL